MVLSVNAPPGAHELSPTFITAPAPHNGTSLLQRLICTSEEGICYGDNLADEILSLVDWAMAMIQRHQEYTDQEADVLAKALDRTPNKWMPELAPAFDPYMSALFSVLYNLPQAAADFAKTEGREQWSVSKPGIPAQRASELLSLFPKARVIFIHRNPLSAFRDHLRDAPGANIEEFGKTWNTHCRDYLALSSDRVLKLRYEDAVESPEAFIQGLEAFTGCTISLPDDVQDKNEAESTTNTQITAEQKGLLQAYCSDMLSVYYPSLVA